MDRTLNMSLGATLAAYLRSHVVPDDGVSVKETSHSATHVEYDVSRPVPPAFQVFVGGAASLTAHERADISGGSFTSTTITDVPGVCEVNATCTYVQASPESTDASADVRVAWGARAPPSPVQDAVVAAARAWTLAAFDRLESLG